MAEVEWDHEAYFRAKAMSHILWGVMPKWRIPAAREALRSSFQGFQTAALGELPEVHVPMLVR